MEQQGEYLMGKTEVKDIPAGDYQIMEQEDTMRYILTDIISQTENVTVKKEESQTIHGLVKIQGEAFADLKFGDGSVLFENRKIHYGEYSDTATVTNHFEKK